MITSKTIIKNSNVTFGTSGARGLVEDLSLETVFAFTVAFLQSVASRDTLALAIDNRPSSERIASYCISAAQYLGVTVNYYGVVPTPALAFQAQVDKEAAIMVTGSHIPFDRNGLKFYSEQGEISKAEELSILQAEIPLPEKIVEVPMPQASPKAQQNYIRRYVNAFPSTLLAGKTIGIYEHSSAGRELYATIFAQLGAKTISLGRSDKFVPIDTEAVSESDQTQAIEWSKIHSLDAIYSTDGDGDRPLLADDNGIYIRGDTLGFIAATALNIDAIAIPVSCNSSITESNSIKQVSRTKIGSPYVIAALDELRPYGKVAGFEANGGFILASDLMINGQYIESLPTRDAVLPVLAVLSACKGEPLSSLVNKLNHHVTASDRLQNVPKKIASTIVDMATHTHHDLLTLAGLESKHPIDIDLTDGVRVTYKDGDIIHIRPSGNAPELRCYAEANSASKAKSLVDAVLTSVKKNFI